MEKPYNGITIPDEWPPRDMVPESKEPMPLPYLENPPSVIPIDVGRQLFVDHFLIEETTMEQVFHKAEKYRGNPVLAPETEQGMKSHPSVGLHNGGVFYNSEKSLFEMFYHAGHAKARSLHYATSGDMVHWNRPDLGLGSGNMFLKPGGWTGFKRRTAGTEFGVWLDRNAADEGQRYKSINYWGHTEPKPPGKEVKPTPPPSQRGQTPRTYFRPPWHSLHTSRDGIGWSDAVLAGRGCDFSSFFYNPFRGVWVFSIKFYISRSGERLRARWYHESRDFLKGGNWDGAVYWTCADGLDVPEPEGRYPAYPYPGNTCQLYALNAVAYESIMLGMHEIHRGPDNPVCEEGRFPKLVDLEMGYSRDGFHWHRPDRSGFIRGTRNEGDWDRATLHNTMSVCVLLEDRLVFPYWALSGFDPVSGVPGINRGGSIGIATLRRDGFASMRSGDGKGILLTRPVTFTGEYLFVNADIKDTLTVEVCSAKGEPLTGFSREDCIPVTGDSTKAPVRWKGGENLARFANQPLRFRFYLTRGDLYAFWVSPSPGGESRGYVAGGGPDFKGDRDD